MVIWVSERLIYFQDLYFDVAKKKSMMKQYIKKELKVLNIKRIDFSK